MDNCSIHLGESVREMIEAAGAKLIYSPPGVSRILCKRRNLVKKVLWMINGKIAQRSLPMGNWHCPSLR